VISLAEGSVKSTYQERTVGTFARSVGYAHLIFPRVVQSTL
jgi:hypothetical protein